MVTTETPTGELQDITDKREMERAIMENNEKKIRQSYNTPFFCQPLLSEFGVKGITQASATILAGVYESNQELSTRVTELLQHFQMPTPIRDLGYLPMEMTLADYQSYWQKVNERISCSPGPLSFATMKTGAYRDMIL
jgi:hypothetical protein